MDDNFKFQVDVMERLTAIETLLKNMNFKEVEQMSEEALSLAKRNSEDIAKLQSAQTWIVRTILAAIISAIMAFILVK